MIRSKNIWILLGIVALSQILIFGVNDPATSDPNRDDIYHEHFKRNYGIYTLNIPDEIFFAGERVPLEDLEIMERFDRELLVNTYWQSNGLLLIKRTKKYFPIITPILRKYGVPEDFKYLAVAESGLQNIVSPAGATGFWQLMKAAAQENDLVVNNEVDERYHVAKATEAACKYLLEAYDRFGSWTLAAASYNMGMNGLEKQLERQEAKSYYDLTLNSETARYLFRIMALKEVLENPDDHGFHFREKDLYPYPATYSLKVDTPIQNLAAFARHHRISYRILKVFNPWLRQAYLKDLDGQSYWIEIPKEGFVVESFDPDTVHLDSSEQRFLRVIQDIELPLDSVLAQWDVQIDAFLSWNPHLDSASQIYRGEMFYVPEPLVSAELKEEEQE